MPAQQPRNELILGDCKVGMKKLRKGSIDILSTDPPYIAELWEEAYTTLASGTMRVLKPGGFCLTYTPQRHFAEIFHIMEDAGLTFFWPIPQLNLGKSTAMVHDRNAICLHKPILVWCKLQEDGKVPKPPKPFADVIRGFRQKHFHPWQQSIHDQLGTLSRFALPGYIVLDPYMGSGTTCLAGKLLGMDYLGYEIDPVTYAKAVDRMGQQPIDMSSFPGKKRRR